MNNVDESLNQKISQIHLDDSEQLEIIFSENKRIIVEAPAGSGKTKTLISVVAYNIVNKKIPSTKKILALTFSINASYKIKKDVIEQLPSILNLKQNNLPNISKNILVSNYHGLCRRILALYGQKLVTGEFAMNDMITGGESDIPKVISFATSEKATIDATRNAISRADLSELNNNIDEYNRIVLDKLIPSKYITYNAIITLVLLLFKNFPHLKEQYQKLFSFIIVDEYQDTNILGYLLLKELINNDTKLLFLGDRLQRIYGFTGAMNNILDLSQSEFNMSKITLDKNYRFKDNPDLLLLDKNIRKNADNVAIAEISNPNIISASTYDKEVAWIIDKLKESIASDEYTAVLVKSLQNNNNTLELLKELRDKNISFFYALFTDESPEYINFHEKLYEEFIKTINLKKVINKKILEEYYLKIYNLKYDGEIYDSLRVLLRKFIDSIYEIYDKYNIEDLIQHCIDVLSNKGLRQYMNKIDEKVVIATIHAFKGLEADTVIICDIESKIFPFYLVCDACGNLSSGCTTKNIEQKSFLEELSVFYVAITRARKELYLTYSKTQLLPWGGSIACNRSCFLDLDGIGNDNMIEI